MGVSFAFGNRTSMTNSSGSTSYTYDDADRITGVQPPSPAPAISYTWDDNGNLTDRGADSFEWDYEDRLVEATVNSVTSTLVYRGDGLRDSRTVGMTTTTFTWDINAGLPVVLDDGNQYLYGAGLSAMKQSGDWFYYLADGLGSTMAVVDSSGDVENGYTYDVYGEPAVTGSLANEFDFAGQQTDGSTGLQYLRARYYDPETGVFLSRDPLAVGPGWMGNPFGYAGANPARLVDPTGNRACDVDACEDRPVLPASGARCGPSWNCGYPKPAPPPGSANDGSAAVACTMTPPFNCASPKPPTTLGDVIGSLAGEYKGLALSLLDLVPLAETCAAAGGYFTAGVAAPAAYTACQPLETAIGTLAFIYGEQGVQRSNCSQTRKGAARVANSASWLLDSGVPGSEVFETMLFAAQVISLSC